MVAKPVMFPAEPMGPRWSLVQYLLDPGSPLVLCWKAPERQLVQGEHMTPCSVSQVMDSLIHRGMQQLVGHQVRRVLVHALELADWGIGDPVGNMLSGLAALASD